MLLHEFLDTAAVHWAERVGIVCKSKCLTFGGMREHSINVAKRLTDLGIRRGDRVVIGNSPDVMLPALIYGCSRVGAVFVMLDEGAPLATVERIIADAHPKVAIGGSSDLKTAASTHGVAHRPLDVFRTEDHSNRIRELGDLPNQSDPACLVYTSGSTAYPKGVVCTHEQMAFVSKAIQSQLEYTTGDVVFCILTLSFDYGLYQMFLSCLAGSTLWLGGRDSAGPRLLRDMCESKATVFPSLPALSGNVIKLMERGIDPSVPCLRLLTNTGESMPRTHLSALRRLIPGLSIQLMYGLTECKRATIMPKDGDLLRPMSCGVAIPGTEVLVVDSSGNELPSHVVGEVIVRGPHVMGGYWRQPNLTARRFRPVSASSQELCTGDYGWLDRQGYLYLSGRRDGQYKQSGIRVSTAEVEAAASRIPGVCRAVVVPPRAGGDATLVVEATISGVDVLRALRSELEEGKIPGDCVVVVDIPVDLRGKVDRRRAEALVGGDACD